MEKKKSLRIVKDTLNPTLERRIFHLELVLELHSLKFSLVTNVRIKREEYERRGVTSHIKMIEIRFPLYFILRKKPVTSRKDKVSTLHYISKAKKIRCNIFSFNYDKIMGTSEREEHYL